MNTFYLVKSASEVSAILWDGVSDYTPPEGWTLMDAAAFIAWQEQNPAPPPPPPPVPESASPAYLRIALRRLHGITPPMVSAKIELIPDPQDRQDADDLWEYATSIRRNHPLVGSIAGAFDLSDAQVDEIFRVADAQAA
jgi:hypothetical protein